jgi:hypothetical protein
MALRTRINAGDVYEIDVILRTEWGAPERQSFELRASNKKGKIDWISTHAGERIVTFSLTPARLRGAVRATMKPEQGQ